MWIGSLRLRVRTKDAPYAGTDSLVTAAVLRDGAEVASLRLDHPAEDDLERGAVRSYNYLKLKRSNDKTPELPPGIGQSPPPYPSHGIEFSSGLKGHLRLRLRIHGSDQWTKDSVDLYVREVRKAPTGFDTWAWQEDAEWTYVATWGKDVAISSDASEGPQTWTLQYA